MFLASINEVLEESFHLYLLSGVGTICFFSGGQNFTWLRTIVIEVRFLNIFREFDKPSKILLGKKMNRYK